MTAHLVREHEGQPEQASREGEQPVDQHAAHHTEGAEGEALADLPLRTRFDFAPGRG